MPKVNLGGALPDAKQMDLQSRFKYGMFGHRMHDYDIKHRTLSLSMFGIETSVVSAYHTCRLIRYLWEQIRSAFKIPTQRRYDRYFDELVDVSMEAMKEFNAYAIKCRPYHPNPAYFQDKNMKLSRVIRAAYRHLNTLCDKSGFGNKQLRVMDAENYAKRNIME